MIQIFKQFIDFVLHIDKHLIELAATYHQWTYLIIFGIVFCETGLVVTPFLPGDSLLFAAGALCATGALNIGVLVPGVFIAAVIGDNLNYFVGNFVGKQVTERNVRFIKKEYIDRTEKFYEKHGGKALIMARFVPILRTFAPFVAGAGKMTYPRFLTFCLLGNLLWVNLFCWAGFMFANNEFVKKNFSVVILGIIFVSLIPVVVAWWKSRKASV
ncbi:MAG: DedA family protein [Saprospiraceae bacterium]|jgi:membrane-associated protein|nr:DedA family protein [Saprospiraceae bacterium]